MKFPVYRWRSLKTRVTLSMLVIFLLSIWSLTFYVSRMLRQDMEHLLADQQSSTVAYVAADLSREFAERVLALETVARSIDQSMLAQPAALQATLENHPLLLHLFNAGVIAVSLDGNAVADAPVVKGRRGTNYASNIATQTTLSTGQSVIGRPLIGRVLKQPVFNINAPIRDGQGKVIGALFGVVNLVKPNFLDSIGEHSYGKSGGYLVMDPELKLIVTATDKSRILQPLPEPGINETIDRRRQGDLGTAIALNSLGKEILSSASRVALAGWLVVAALPAEEAFAPIHVMQQRILFATLLFTLLAGGLTWWMLKRQFTPMLTAAKTVSALADSGLAAQPLPISQQDEVGDLIGGVNRLLAVAQQRESALQKSEQLLAEAQSLAKIGSWHVVFGEDEARDHWTISKELQTLYEHSANLESATTAGFALMPAQDREGTRRAWAAAKTGQGPTEWRQCIAVNGRIKWMQVTAKFVFDKQGRALEASGTNQDITERQQAETALVAAKSEAERANHAKSRFLAAASHDLRQPLAALALYVSVLKSRGLPESVDLVASIQECCDSLSELLTDLLDVSKLDAGVLRPKLSDFAVDDFLRSLVAMHSAEAALKGLRLRLRHCGPAFAHTDHQLVTRIVRNLVANAIRYTNQGGILIACRRHAGKQWIEVWDTGIGIPADKKEFIFEEFRQLGTGSARLGSGLGLAIVAKTAALLGLQIRLRSRPGRGSMFAIELPVGRSVVPAQPRTVQVQARSLRVALVEDDLQLLLALMLALETAGHEVISGASSKELVERLGRRAPDIVISDYSLGAGETGFDVIEVLKAAFGAELPAIIITGDTDPALIRSMVDRGIAVYFKPVPMELLQTAIRQATECRGE